MSSLTTDWRKRTVRLVTLALIGAVLVFGAGAYLLALSGGVLPAACGAYAGEPDDIEPPPPIDDSPPGGTPGAGGAGTPTDSTAGLSGSAT